MGPRARKNPLFGAAVVKAVLRKRSGGATTTSTLYEGILRDLGVTSIRHLTSSVHDYKGLSGFGIEIVSNEQLEG